MSNLIDKLYRMNGRDQKSFAARCLRMMFTFVLAVGGVIVLNGCATAATESRTLANPSPIGTAVYRPAFDASVAVLRDAGFEIDRQDYRFGRISSRPKGSPTVFEPWKPDNTYADQSMRSTLGNLRRTVTVSLETSPKATPSAGPDKPQNASSESQTSGEVASEGGYGLRVEVLLERFQVPARRMNGAARGAVFADLREAPGELQERGITGPYWQPIGRDLHLEQRLLESILDRAAANSAG